MICHGANAWGGPSPAAALQALEATLGGDPKLRAALTGPWPGFAMTVLPPPKLRILVVEDDPLTLASTIELLELLGHWATGVKSAEVAMSRFLEGAFDVLFIDLNLPGLSGLELADNLRTREPLPVIFASGGGQPLKSRQRRRYGCASPTRSANSRMLLLSVN